MSCLIGIHQPNFMPWIGLISKIYCCDKFVLLDDVFFSKNNFQNRNKINTPDGPIWLSVPIQMCYQQPIHQTLISSIPKNWRQKHLRSLFYSYRKAQNFDEMYGELERIYKLYQESLLDLNLAVLDFIIKYLGIQTEMHLSSRFDLEMGRTERLVSLCLALQGDSYMHGGDAGYMDRTLFERRGIRLVAQNFKHPVYRQMYSNSFIPNLSIIDWMMQSSKVEILSYFEQQKERIAGENLQYFAAYHG